MSDYLLGRYADRNWLAATLYACVPNWQLFWTADALAAKQQIPLEYVLWGSVYIVLLMVLFMTLAILLFWRREVGRQSVG